MLKTVLGKVVVGAVAFSSIATHAANFNSGWFGEFKAGSKIKVGAFKEDSLLPKKLIDGTFSVSGGFIINPAYVWGQAVSIEGFYNPFWNEAPVVALGSEEDKAKTSSWLRAPDVNLYGGLVKVGLPFASAESIDTFVQVGLGGLNKGFAGFFGGAGFNVHIDGGLYFTMAYKHLLPVKNVAENHFGTLTIGGRYNF